MIQYLNAGLELLEQYVIGVGLIPALWGIGIFFTYYLGFPQVRYFGRAINILLGKEKVEGAEGDTSSFQALTASLGGSIGTGSIAGVALAIHLGGPSSLFWMLITGFLGMATKFVEVALSHKYRKKASDGTMSGGPMYYMRERLNLPKLGDFFAVIIIIAAFAGGSLPQTNSIASAAYFSFGISEWLTGIVVCASIIFVVVGGIKRIGQAAEMLMPLMAFIYVVSATVVLISYPQNVIPAFLSIFTNIWSGTAAMGGFLGTGVFFAITQGISRGFYSNEAGSGTAGITHASSRIDDPVTEGIVTILEPFISTTLICMLTGMSILVGGAWTQKVHNKFDYADILVAEGRYNTDDPKDVQQLAQSYNATNTLGFTGTLEIQEGDIQNQDITLLNSHSVAEDVKVYQQDQLFTGTIAVHQGRITATFQDITFQGKSLLNGINLVVHTFQESLLGHLGAYIISISILLFAFTTIIAWYYYGDRSLVYLGGEKYLTLYKIAFILASFAGTITDATIVWNMSATVFALMAFPNLLGLILAREDVRDMLQEYQKADQKRQRGV